MIPRSPLTAMFKSGSFDVHDEIYTMAMKSWSRDNVRVLTSIDYAKMSPEDRALEEHPRPDHDFGLSWIRHEGQGRVFYEALGHSERIYAMRPMLEHLLAGMQYVLGDLEGRRHADQALTRVRVSAVAVRRSTPHSMRKTMTAMSVGPIAPASSPSGEIAFVEKASEQCLAGWIRRVRDHRQSAADHGPLHDGELQLVSQVWNQGREIGDERVVVDGGQRRGADEQGTFRQPAEHRTQSTTPAARRG